MAERKRRTKRQAGASDGKAPDPVQLIVRRGALKRYARLTEQVQDLPVVLTWDRRTRGSAADGDGKPAAERRGTPPFTWETADFLVVDEGRQGPEPKKPRGSSKPRGSTRPTPAK